MPGNKFLVHLNKFWQLSNKVTLLHSFIPWLGRRHLSSNLEKKFLVSAQSWLQIMNLS